MNRKLSAKFLIHLLQLFDGIPIDRLKLILNQLAAAANLIFTYTEVHISR